MYPVRDVVQDVILQQFRSTLLGAVVLDRADVVKSLLLSDKSCTKIPDLVRNCRNGPLLTEHRACLNVSMVCVQLASSCLHRAVACSTPDIIRMLLEAGVSVNGRDKVILPANVARIKV
jgi:hypothetical protein